MVGQRAHHPIDITIVLSRSGSSLIVVAEGVEGLAKTKSQPIEMAITDLNMPMMNGLESFRALQGIPSVAGMPIGF